MPMRNIRHVGYISKKEVRDLKELSENKIYPLHY
jgi:hypothetical protein